MSPILGRGKMKMGKCRSWDIGGATNNGEGTYEMGFGRTRHIGGAINSQENEINSGFVLDWGYQRCCQYSGE